MKTYQYLWKMICYRPRLYATNLFFWTAIHLSPLIPGLIAQQFFNALPGAGHLNNNLWLLIMLLVITALGRAILFTGGALADILHRFSMVSLLRRNLLERILERPGARAIPGSVGEALNRIEDDAERAEDAISWLLDSIGTLLFAVVAFV